MLGSSLQNSGDNGDENATDQDRLSATVGLRSIRTEKFDPIYRQVTPMPADNEEV